MNRRKRKESGNAKMWIVVQALDMM